MEAMADAYSSWSLATAEEGLAYVYTQPPDAIQQDAHRVLVIDMYSTSGFFFLISLSH
jgi:hypothetical protein